MAKLFANSRDPDQTPHSVASDLGLHCLPVTLLGISSLQWVNSFVTNVPFYLNTVDRPISRLVEGMSGYSEIHFMLKCTKYDHIRR